MEANEITAAEARELLAILRRRDEIVRAAYQAGINKRQIFEISGIARTTIDRILPETVAKNAAGLALYYLSSWLLSVSGAGFC
jgi:hypothetical protein